MSCSLESNTSRGDHQSTNSEIERKSFLLLSKIDNSAKYLFHNIACLFWCNTTYTPNSWHAYLNYFLTPVPLSVNKQPCSCKSILKPLIRAKCNRCPCMKSSYVLQSTTSFLLDLGLDILRDSTPHLIELTKGSFPCLSVFTPRVEISNYLRVLRTRFEDVELCHSNLKV